MNYCNRRDKYRSKRLDQLIENIHRVCVMAGINRKWEIGNDEL